LARLVGRTGHEPKKRVSPASGAVKRRISTTGVRFQWLSKGFTGMPRLGGGTLRSYMALVARM
jgi:hypothetical protein